jgi:hypothetical protein
VKKVPAVVLWAIAFAFVESAVVEYLRGIYYPMETGGFQFPVLTLNQLQAMGEWHMRRLAIEVGRELSTLVMLAAVSLAASRNRREAWAHFMIAFGVWDIFYYVWLKVFLDWPSSLMTWDLLFLLPVPWVSPVLAPIIISVALIASGLIVLSYEDRDRPLKTSWMQCAALTAGAMTVIGSFCSDYENIINGGLPAPFNWTLFFIGMAIGVGTFVSIVVRLRHGRPEKRLSRSD